LIIFYEVTGVFLSPKKKPIPKDSTMDAREELTGSLPIWGS
jgi:hypothetical protein